MDRRESPFQLLTICQKLFDIIINCLASQTHKTIILGDPRLRNRFAEMPNSAESQGSSNAGAERKLDPSTGNLSCQGLSSKNPNFHGKLALNDHEEPPLASSIGDNLNSKEQIRSRYDDPGEKEQQHPIPEDQSQEKGVRTGVSFDHKVEIIEWRKRKVKKY